MERTRGDAKVENQKLCQAITLNVLHAYTGLLRVCLYVQFVIIKQAVVLQVPEEPVTMVTEW